MQRVEQAIFESGCFTITRFLEYHIRITKTTTFAVIGKGNSIFSIELNLSRFDEVDLFTEVSFPVYHIVFVNFDFSQALYKWPHKVTIRAVPQEVDGFNQATKPEKEHFFSQSCRQLMQKLVFINSTEEFVVVVLNELTNLEVKVLW